MDQEDVTGDRVGITEVSGDETTGEVGLAAEFRCEEQVQGSHEFGGLEVTK